MAPFLQFTNRCLLKWLKLWDLVVFGQERPARKPRPSVEPVRVGKEAITSSKWKSHEQVLEEMLEAELDPSQRPRQKVSPTWLYCILLLSQGLYSLAGTFAAFGGHEAHIFTACTAVYMMMSGSWYRMSMTQV